LRNSNFHLPLGKQSIAHVEQNSIRGYCRRNPPQPLVSCNEQDPLTVLCCPREAAGAAVAGDSSYAPAEGFIHKDTVISVVVFPLHMCLGRVSPIYGLSRAPRSSCSPGGRKHRRFFLNRCHPSTSSLSIKSKRKNHSSATVAGAAVTGNST
jgi:hypothetical protein